MLRNRTWSFLILCTMFLPLMVLHAAPVMITVLCVLTLGYRYYAAFIAARVLVLDDSRVTPAHTRRDGHNFVPTGKWVLFGHHFAAISGSGPLIGPTLAAQFGFAPGFLWILAGVVLAGAVHDFVILTASIRHQGKSLAEIARELLGGAAGNIAMIAVLLIVVISLAGLGVVVVGALSESAWGTFTVGATIPIALMMGVYAHKISPGKSGVRNSTFFGLVLLFAALIYGNHLQASPLGEHFRFSRTELTFGIAAYGFFASVLPVWLLLTPRDYLSSYLKIGTIALLVVGVIFVNPQIKAPMISQWAAGGGPIVKGPLFPFVFVTIACGAISGFHSLVSSGTTPKMLDKESDARAIGYGAMLMEGLVGITALIAATSLPVDDYFAINTDRPVQLASIFKSQGDYQTWVKSLANEDTSLLKIHRSDPPETWSRVEAPISVILSLSGRALSRAGFRVDEGVHDTSTLTHEDYQRLGIAVSDVPALSKSTHERIVARTGGGVSLAVGMARIFSGLPFIQGIKDLLAYWYHFAIMFEALFILTVIDAGTRIGRFLVQEMLGRLHPTLGRSDHLGAAILATTLITLGWTLLLLTGSVQTIWPMFGIANQLLAVVALAVGTTVIFKWRGRFRYALITALPLLFVGTTTITAACQGVAKIYWPMTYAPEASKRIQGWVDSAFTSLMLVCVIIMLFFAVRAWRALAKSLLQQPS